VLFPLLAGLALLLRILLAGLLLILLALGTLIAILVIGHGHFLDCCHVKIQPVLSCNVPFHSGAMPENRATLVRDRTQLPVDRITIRARTSA
jgi:hypothetical protein